MVEEEPNSDDDDWKSAEEKVIIRKPRSKKLLLTGLNQMALCEDPGFDEPVEIRWPWGNTNMIDKKQIGMQEEEKGEKEKEGADNDKNEQGNRPSTGTVKRLS